jgi:hypothetical protein
VLDGAPDRLLDTYEAERRPVAAGVLNLSGALAKGAGGSATLTRGRETQQLDLNYRQSPLSMDKGRTERSLRAGDRAPDAPYADAAGNQSRLFQAYAGPHFTVVVFADAPVEIPAHGPETRTIRAPLGGLAARTYQIEAPAVVVIRPDNYIGLIDEQPSPSAVADYFSRLLAA